MANSISFRRQAWINKRQKTRHETFGASGCGKSGGEKCCSFYMDWLGEMDFLQKWKRGELQMKIITFTGYGWSGSSVIYDYMKEFDNVCFMDEFFEFRLIQDPNGVSDLEFHLIENNHRNNTSYGIKHFIKYTNWLNGTWYRKRYRKFWGNDFKKYTQEYVSKITELKTRSWWYGDRNDFGPIKYFLDAGIGRLLSTVFNKDPQKMYTLFLNNEYAYYANISKEYFYACTKEYLNNLFSVINKDNKEYLVLDQLVPVSNIKRYKNYFDDLKIFVVDRDPRDLYLYLRNCKIPEIPTRTVQEFCKWFEITRRHRKYEVYDESYVLFIHFEDMIYHYEETAKRVREFLGLDEKNHVAKGRYFVKEKSWKNTQLFRRKENLKYKQDIEYIEKYLTDYLYDYPQKEL